MSVVEQRQSSDADQAWQDEYSLPPRSSLHPSNRIKIVKIFYTFLLLLFISLLVGLVLWGKQLLMET